MAAPKRKVTKTKNILKKINFQKKHNQFIVNDKSNFKISNSISSCLKNYQNTRISEFNDLIGNKSSKIPLQKYIMKADYNSYSFSNPTNFNVGDDLRDSTVLTKCGEFQTYTEQQKKYASNPQRPKVVITHENLDSQISKLTSSMDVDPILTYTLPLDRAIIPIELFLLKTLKSAYKLLLAVIERLQFNIYEQLINVLYCTNVVNRLLNFLIWVRDFQFALVIRILLLIYTTLLYNRIFFNYIVLFLWRAWQIWSMPNKLIVWRKKIKYRRVYRMFCRRIKRARRRLKTYFIRLRNRSLLFFRKTIYNKYVYYILSIRSLNSCIRGFYKILSLAVVTKHVVTFQIIRIYTCFLYLTLNLYCRVTTPLVFLVFFKKALTYFDMIFFLGIFRDYVNSALSGVSGYCSSPIRFVIFLLPNMRCSLISILDFIERVRTRVLAFFKNLWVTLDLGRLVLGDLVILLPEFTRRPSKYESCLELVESWESCAERFNPYSEDFQPYIKIITSKSRYSAPLRAVLVSGDCFTHLHLNSIIFYNDDTQYDSNFIKSANARRLFENKAAFLEKFSDMRYPLPRRCVVLGIWDLSLYISYFCQLPLVNRCIAPTWANNNSDFSHPDVRATFFSFCNQGVSYSDFRYIKFLSSHSFLALKTRQLIFDNKKQVLMSPCDLSFFFLYPLTPGLGYSNKLVLKLKIK